MKNREIKFRAWDKVDKKIIYPDIENFGAYLQKWLAIPEDYILMQYTGLKDKNGKEIYEGDIVKTITSTFNDGQQNIEEKVIGVVEWGDQEDQLCLIIVDKKDNVWMMSQFEGREKEVIGNIYQNKNLTN